jgi:hypothetical protein
MTENEQPLPPAFTLAMLLRSLLFGGVVGLTLFLLNSPLWAFYVVPPIPMAPWIIWELLRLDSQPHRGEKAKASEQSRSPGKLRNVA